jgi:hypothetical protein
VEPPIIELEEALGCEPSDDAISLDELLEGWPAGKYEFEARTAALAYAGKTRLTHRIPAGPEIITPQDGTVVPADEPLVIAWKKVKRPLLRRLGPVRVIGYHVLLKNVSKTSVGPQVPPALDIDVPADATTIVVPAAYFEPGQIYEFEILATEKWGNQTITEGGAICTDPRTPLTCELP